MTEIQILVEPRESDGDRGTLGLALANIAELGDDSGTFGRIVMSDVIVPMTRSGDPARINLLSGRYVVSVAMPTGERINELLEVLEQDTIELVLRPPLPVTEYGQRPPEAFPPRRAVRKARQDSSAPVKSVRVRTANRTSDPTKPVVEVVPPKPQALLSVKRSKKLPARDRAGPPEYLMPPESAPGLVDIRPLSQRQPAPLVKDYSFIDLQSWLRELRYVADTGARLTSDPLERGRERATLASLPDTGISPDFEGELTDNYPDVLSIQRYTCSVDANGSVRQVAVLPFSWITEAGGRQDNVVDVYQEWDGLAATWNLRSTIKDARMSSVLDFMASGDLPRARHLISQNLQMLMEKVQNPYAATAAAYVLIYSRDSDLEHGRWPEWLKNLASWFPSLPDGQILLATLCLQRRRLTERARLPIGRSDEDRLKLAHVLLERAMRAGIPMFSLGMRLLLENLEILQEEISPDYRYAMHDNNRYSTMPLDEALERVKAVSRCMKTVQPMTVLDFAGVPNRRQRFDHL
jgi:hypothetical protein